MEFLTEADEMVMTYLLLGSILVDTKKNGYRLNWNKPWPKSWPCSKL